jgi:hypothetical protein
MKKLTLLAIAFILFTFNAKAQFYESGCGWVFKSTENVLVFKTKKKQYGNARIEFYYNSDCDKKLLISYGDGSTESYYFKTTRIKNKGYTDDGDYFESFDMYNYADGTRVRFQIVMAKNPYLRMFYANGFAEFS